jgi:predicted DNA-binding transcriptional regulator YafY
MLIDGLLFSRSVPYQPRKELIEKLGKLSGPYFSQRMKHVHSMNADAPQNPKLFLIIEVLDEAIAEGKQVEIVYGRYGTDLKLHASLNEDGTEKKQLLNPYQLVASDGRYYLICNKDNYNNVANYRVDRIMKIDKLETPAKPGNQVQGLEDGLKLQDYVYQHVNMFSGKPERVEFIIQKKDVGLIVDFFGKHVSFFDRGDGTISCHMKVSRTAMKKFALQFAKEVRVVEPESLVEEIREDIRKINQNYGMDEMKEGDREG